jgi:hypothetical protein
MTELTEYRRARYTSKTPNSCPYCETSDGDVVEVDTPFKAGDFSIWQEHTCLVCRNNWYNIYQLIDIEPKERN